MSLARCCLVVAILGAAAGCGGDLVDVSAERYHPEEDCFGDPELVGHIERPSGCDTSFFYAKDGSGACFRFPDSCVPSRFHVTGYDATACGSPNQTPRRCSATVTPTD